MGKGAGDRTSAEPKNTAEFLRHLRATLLPDANNSRHVGSSAPPPPTNVSAAAPKAAAPRRSQASAPRDSKHGVKQETPPGKKKKSERKRAPPRKSSRRLSRNSSPSSSSSSRSDSGSSSSSSNSDDSPAEDHSTSVNSSTLRRFDEAASMGDRRSWWERFLNISAQGGWTEMTELRELKMKMSAPVRSWRAQLSKHTQKDWNKLAKEFRRKFLKSRTSEPERYFTMKQKSGETAMQFFYRLNEAAIKADIRYKKDKKDVDDLEYILEQGEDFDLDGGYDTPPPGISGRTTSRPGVSSRVVPAGLTFEDEADSSDEDPPEPRDSGRGFSKPSSDDAPKVATAPSPPTEQDVNRMILRAIENWGGSHRCRRALAQDGSRLGRKCSKFGHKEKNCWKDVKCDKCGRPDRTPGLCVQTLQAVKTLARQGMLKDLPAHVLKKLLDGEANQGKSLNELKLKFRVLPEPVKVTGLGGAPTYITASSRVKITLGFRVVYVLDVWVTNIGEDVEVLLGMNFMYAAGLRLCVREGHIRLPDEEIVLMCNTTLRQNRGLDIPVTSEQNLYLRPGEHATKEVVWAGRGDRWVTCINYAAKSWARSVKVVNISNQMVWIDTRTPVARIVEFGCYPMSGRFVRPGSRKYQEWQTLIYENTPSPEERKKQMELEDLEWARQPPAVKPAEYPWPSRIQVMVDRKKKTSREIPVQARPRPLRAGVARAQPWIMCDVAIQTSTTVEIGTQTDPIALGQEEMAEKTLDVSESDSPAETASETEPGPAYANT
ncbi:hypothetical protein PHYSODRAFT_326081 [Phytophthora sojae]|uniref:Retrotransposon gag domain-containing protein n=1 Tax=Phytophthora sojae (strain P6497) TaxID=1094619 RepID=G4YX29_PHYSP|nr:hypothetical protein PHYSODRAFT_326081 [Phytophthora sojae]EGZ25036.1 hypothetical protein PHYSODRAFT_326081 [Phytophthora sojae]|eukprot:XP_009520324.1 hypothetical protein PHYSODRAFT_326081 [Phytophthora sojae]